MVYESNYDLPEAFSRWLEGRGGSASFRWAHGPQFDHGSRCPLRVVPQYRPLSPRSAKGSAPKHLGGLGMGTNLEVMDYRRRRRGNEKKGVYHGKVAFLIKSEICTFQQNDIDVRTASKGALLWGEYVSFFIFCIHILPFVCSSSSIPSLLIPGVAPPRKTYTIFSHYAVIAHIKRISFKICWRPLETCVV